LVGTDPDAMPANCTIMEFPKGTYFCGRYNGNGVGRCRLNQVDP
jgi:hypothetical protein